MAVSPRYSLLCDGSSDQRLIPIIDWLLNQHASEAMAAQWADVRQLAHVGDGLGRRIDAALEYFPADLLIVHRDAESASPAARYEEIVSAAESRTNVVIVPLVPVRMQEAWLLFDEPAIRTAAGSPSGTGELNLPRTNRVETEADPKSLLSAALKHASGLSGRKLHRFKVPAAANRVAQLIEDFSPLRTVSSFQRFESDLISGLRDAGLYRAAGEGDPVPT